MQRRQFLRVVGRTVGYIVSGCAGFGALAGGQSGRAWAFGDWDRLQIGQILLPQGQGGPRPDCLRRLMWELEKRTSIEVRQEPALVRLQDPELFRHPLLYLTGDREFPLPGDDDLARLRRHLLAGGMLIIDSAEGRAGGGFDQSVRALCARVLPRTGAGAGPAPLGPGLQRLPEDHVIYRSFYLMRTPAGRVLALPYLEAVLSAGPAQANGSGSGQGRMPGQGPQAGARALIVYSQNDLGGAWARDNFGQWEHEVVPGGEAQREQAFRLGVNLVMYALCLDYKADQVHVPFIMRRRPLAGPGPLGPPRPPGQGQGR